METQTKQIETLNAGDSIRTYSGKYINVFEPNPDDILIEDIAHSLSNQQRFGGHLPRKYSVAEHSIICSKFGHNIENRLDLLMHDASEAYLLDIPSPIKRKLPCYKKIEHKLMLVIAEKFNFNWPCPQHVKSVDQYILEAEFDVIMLNRNIALHDQFFTYYQEIVNQDIRSIFLDEFEKLTK